MALKFKCDNCQQVMIVRAHKVGESAACGSCGRYSRVPESAENVEEEGVLKTDGTSPASGKDFSNKYPALRTIASFYKILAVGMGFFAILFFIVGIVQMAASPDLAAIILISSVVLGAISIITCFALSEGIMIYLDMANDLSKIKEDMGNDLSEIKRRLINSSD